MRVLRLISLSVLVLLLAVGLGMMGHAETHASVNGQGAPSVAMDGAGAVGGCGACGTNNHMVMLDSCVTAICWNLPAASAQSLPHELPTAVLFGIEAYDLGAGTSGGPDHHPPRSPLRP